MIQNVLTYSIGILVLGIIVYRVWRIWHRTKQGDSPCAGCSGGCALHQSAEEEEKASN